MYKILLTLSLIFSVILATAQDTEKIPVDPITVAGSSFNYYNKTKFKTDDKEYDVTNAEWRTSLMYGGNIYKEKLFLLGGLEYHKFFHTRHMDTGNLSENYTAYLFNAGAIAVLPNNWKIIPFYTGRFGSDFKNTDNDEYFYAASLFAQKKHSDHFIYGLGVYHRNGFDAGQWLPMVKLLYQHNHWVLNIFVPSWAGIHYDFNKNTRIGARATFNSSVFNTDSYEISNTLSFTTTTLGLQFRQRLFSDIFLFAETGTTYSPEAEFINTTTNNLIAPVGDNHIYFSLGVQMLKF